MTRAMVVIAPWFLAPLAWLIWMLTGHGLQGCGGYCAVASAFGYIAWVIVVGLTLLTTALLLPVASSAGRLRRARRPVLAVGLVGSVPAVALAVFSRRLGDHLIPLRMSDR
jgi:hypothetical protein